KVRTLPGYSGHKDQAGLLGFVDGMQRAPEKIVLVHGERRSKILLASALKQAFACGTRGACVSIPD
ncbi:MBL fold metallo-hydrolase RNA specificity domain-containing protein, partial [Pseudomonas sp. CM27]